MLVFLATGVSFAGVVDQCYADAEADNPGLVVTVKTGSTTRYSGDDLDTAFDKIAQYHTNNDLDVTYDSEGRAALRQAMDCTFDNGYLTLSSAWIQANIADLEVRSYGVALFNTQHQLQWVGEFNEVDIVSGVSYVRFNALNTGDCMAVKSESLSSYDLQADFTVTLNVSQCGTSDCTKCKKGQPCNCKTGDGSCEYNPIVSTLTSNGAIMKVVE